MVVTAALRLARKRSIVNLMRGDCNEFFPAGEDLGKLDTSEPEDEELIVYTRCKRQERHRGHNKHKCQDKVDDADVKVSELSEDENAPDMKPNVPEEKK
ncbi:unnamed protein product [Notodromas monacha]|uniref:Uncharacterized protein n=1 Tax=Notodromas monacha TaxID=399045 RepID=A0A7R9C1B3_9CRUS|nr:unnamed protein product [Notodromas monacha]CAG0925506.1 unnamed protein product [Notodromas monacha]